jgi:hypothetical protein
MQRLPFLLERSVSSLCQSCWNCYRTPGGGIPSRQKSSEHSAHSRPAGSRSTLPVRISRRGSPDVLADCLSRPARHSQTRTLADPKIQNNHVLFRLFIELCRLVCTILKHIRDRNALRYVHFIRRKHKKLLVTISYSVWLFQIN